MRLLILALLATLPATAANAADACKASAPQPARTPLQPRLRAQPLTDLPDARAIRAVIRTVDGCQYLDVLRERVSSGNALDSGRAWVLAPEHKVVPARP